jgi:hypothetical protein
MIVVCAGCARKYECGESADVLINEKIKSYCAVTRQHELQVVIFAMGIK